MRLNSGTTATKKPASRKAAARSFAKKWAGRGYEKDDTPSSWLELLRDVVGMEDVPTNVLFEQRTSWRGFIDVTIADVKTIIERKSLGVDLDKQEERQGVMVTPFEQVRNYANTLPNSQRSDYIFVCDFNIFRIHNLNKENPKSGYTEFTLTELQAQLYLLDFLIDPQSTRQKREEQVSITVGTLIGRLYSLLRQRELVDQNFEDLFLQYQFAHDSTATSCRLLPGVMIEMPDDAILSTLIVGTFGSEYSQFFATIQAKNWVGYGYTTYASQADSHRLYCEQKLLVLSSLCRQHWSKAQRCNKVRGLTAELVSNT